MTQFNPSIKYPTDFNKGNKYKAGDAVQSKTINDLIESALWVQELAFDGAIIIGDITYTTEISSQSSLWQEVSGKFQIRILQTTHGFNKINSIVAERKTATDMYENMIYSYKRYLTGTVAVTVDDKIDMRIIIKGEK